MKTVYLRQKKSGNFEITNNKKDSTHKMNSKKSAQEFWNDEIKYGKKVVKATYRLSQTYFTYFEEFYNAIKS